MKISLRTEGYGEFIETTEKGTTAAPNKYSSASVLVQKRGNVGIGTPNPSQKLDVTGRIVANKIRVLTDEYMVVGRPVGPISKVTMIPVGAGFCFLTSTKTSIEAELGFRGSHREHCFIKEEDGHWVLGGSVGGSTHSRVYCHARCLKYR